MEHETRPSIVDQLGCARHAELYFKNKGYHRFRSHKFPSHYHDAAKICFILIEQMYEPTFFKGGCFSVRLHDAIGGAEYAYYAETFHSAFQAVIRKKENIKFEVSYVKPLAGKMIYLKSKHEFSSALKEHFGIIY